MVRERVLLSEGSSLTARETMTILGSRGIGVDVASASGWPLASFSTWCRGVRRVPSAERDPVGYLRAIDALLASGRYRALLATHEQAWLLAAGREHLPHASGRLAVAEASAFEQVQSKIAFAGLCDELGIPQPAWHEVRCEADLDRVGYPAWIKAAYSTAGRGVKRVGTHAEAASAWRALGADGAAVMVQAPARGAYRQVAALFDRGRLIAAACSERIGLGVGGSAAARLSVSDPTAVDAVHRLGRRLSWHGGLTCDYFADDLGRNRFIECNPRTTEPGNAAAAGVNLPLLSIALATGGRLPRTPLIARAGVRTRSTVALALGAAERRGSRRAVLRSLARALRHRPPLQGSCEVLTPVGGDPLSLAPALVVVGSLLARPRSVTALADSAVSAYAVTPRIIDRLRS